MREVIEQYRRWERARQGVGEISSGWLHQIEIILADLDRFAGHVLADKFDEQVVEAYYLDVVNRKQANGHRYAPDTIKHFIKVLRSMIQYGWEHRLLEMPRNLRRLKAPKAKPKPRALSLLQVHAAYDAATWRVRLFISLALNCGHGQTEIASLRPEELQDGYLIRERHKTGVPCRHLLWPVTFKLIDAFRVEAGDLLFRTADGNPLVERTVRDAKFVHNDSVLQAWNRLRVKVGLKEFGFYNLRDTGASALAALGYDDTIQAMYLGHAPSGMRRHYRDPSSMNARMDEAISKLDDYFQLSRLQIRYTAEHLAALVADQEQLEKRPGYPFNQQLNKPKPAER